MIVCAKCGLGRQRCCVDLSQLKIKYDQLKVENERLVGVIEKQRLLALEIAKPYATA